MGLAADAVQCSRCGQAAISAGQPDLSYGMLDLGAGVGAPALDLSSAFPPATQRDSSLRQRRSSRASGRPSRRASGPTPRGPTAEPPPLELQVPVRASRPSRAEADGDEQRKETPAERKHRRIQQLARYGTPPASWLHAPAYWARVTLRRRVLASELSTRSAERKQAERRVEDARVRMAEVLYAAHRDPRLQPLARQLRAVAESATAIDAVQVAGQKRKANMQHNLTEVEGRLGQLQAQARPVRARCDELLAQVAQWQAYRDKAERRCSKIGGELRAARGRSQPDAERLSKLQGEGDALRREIEERAAQIAPLEQELAARSEELARLDAVIAKVTAERDATEAAISRAEEHARVESGTAYGALRQALLALSQAAAQSGLDVLAQRESEGVETATQLCEQRRRKEELHRSAMGAYDAQQYQLGGLLTIGGSGAALLILLLLILL